MPFRTDIAGLRAWAVLLVVLYHFGVTGIGGGFIGVDVFFVLSGFLMAGILQRILSNPARSKLWLADFLLARGQRILPALLVLILCWMIWGWFRLGPEEYRAVALEGVRAMVFQSNRFYAEAADYFAPVPEIRLFLHSWSLSVEWMFYIWLAALALVIGLVTSRKAVFIAAIGLISLASFLWMLWLSRTDPTNAFFLLAPRAWEMGAGVLVFHLSQRLGTLPPQRAACAEYAGFALIALCLLPVFSQGVWPGPATLLPVLGTGLVLIAARPASPLTAPAPLQALGEISYSLYLWHWPVSVALRQSRLDDQPLWQAAGILISLIAGTLSWALVERPSRRALARRGRLVKFLALFAAIIATGLILTSVRKTDGFPGRLPPGLREETLRLSARGPLNERCVNGDGQARPCAIGEPGPPDLVIFGDSHAGAVVDALAASDFGRAHRIEVFAHSGCSPIFGAIDKNGPSNCGRFTEASAAAISQLPPSVPLLIINRLPYHLEGENAVSDRQRVPEFWLGERPAGFTDDFRAEMSEALGLGICRLAGERRVLVLETVPEMRLNPLSEREAAAIRGEAFTPPSVSREAVAARLETSLAAVAAASALCGAELIGVRDIFCDETRCSTVHNGQISYRDDDHLSESGAALLIPAIEAALGLE